MRTAIATPPFGMIVYSTDRQGEGFEVIRQVSTSAGSRRVVWHGDLSGAVICRDVERLIASDHSVCGGFR